MYNTGGQRKVLEFEYRDRIENYDDERLFHDPHVDPLRRIQGTLQEVSRPIYNANITLVLPNRNLNVDRIGRIVFWYEFCIGQR